MNIFVDDDNPVQDRSFIEDFIGCTIYCEDMICEDIDTISQGNIQNILLLAEASKRQGRLSEALYLYDFLLSNEKKLTGNQWFIANIGRIHVSLFTGQKDETIDNIELLLKKTDNRLHKAYLHGFYAWINSMLDNNKEALRMYRSCISSLQNYGYPLLLAIFHNNRGIVFFKQDKYKLAEKDFLKAKQYAKKANSKYLEAGFNLNLADIEMKRQNYKKAIGMIENSGRVMLEIGDYHKLTDVEFNKALYYLEINELDKAIYHMKRSEEIAYPLPSPLEKNERRKAFIKRAKVKDIVDMERFL